MKNFIFHLVLLTFCSFRAEADLVFKELSIGDATKKAVAQYNKSIQSGSPNVDGLVMDVKYKKDFKEFVKKNTNVKFWKAETVGERVYFREGKAQFSLRVLEKKNKTTSIVELNSKKIELNRALGFQNNLNAIANALSEKAASFLDAFISVAHADDEFATPESLSKALSVVYALGWFESYFEDLEDTEEQLCGLDKKEEGRELDKEAAFSLYKEIQTLVRIQNKYTRDVLASPSCVELRRADVNRALSAFNDKEQCAATQRIQSCITKLADRRKKSIEKSMSGISCFSVSYNGQVVVLNDKILELPLTDYINSYSALQKKIKSDLVSCQTSCATSNNPSCEAACKAKINKDACTQPVGKQTGSGIQ